MRSDSRTYEPKKPSGFELLLNLIAHLAVMVMLVRFAGVTKGLLAFFVALKVKKALLLHFKGLESIDPMDY